MPPNEFPTTEESAPAEKDIGSSYLFNADAQAILEEAPTLEAGLSSLEESYSSKAWDDGDAAQKTAETYAQELRYRFKDQSLYNNRELHQIAPIDFSEAEGATNYDKAVDWANKNKEFLEQPDLPPNYVMVKDKLNKSIEAKSMELKRAAKFDEHGFVYGAAKDAVVRMVQGATSAPAALLGMKKYNELLTENTDPSRDSDLTSDIASGIGMLEGGIASTVAGPVGVYGYLGATGAGAVKERYNQAKEATGDATKALHAAEIEGAAQTVMLGTGAKVLTQPAKTVFSKIFGKKVVDAASKVAAETAAQKITKAAITMGTAQAAAGVISNKAEAVGTDNPHKDLTDRMGRNFLLGAIFGAGGKGLEVAMDPKVTVDPIVKNGGIPPREEVIAVGSNKNTEASFKAEVGEKPPVSFVTEDGNTYSINNEGSTSRTKIASNEVYNPLDKTFYVNKEVATKLAALRGNTDAADQPVQILTDGKNLYVKSEYVDDALMPVDTNTGNRLVQVPVEDAPAAGLHPVEVNRPKNVEGNRREYRSRIGRVITETVIPEETKSAGAADIRETNERRMAQRIRLDPEVDSLIREGFGDNELGLSRYFKQSNIVTKDRAGKVIDEKGIALSTKEFLAMDDEHASPESVAIGQQLYEGYRQAALAAKQEGNVQAYEDLSNLAGSVYEKAVRSSTNTAQTLQAYNIFKAQDPEMRVAGLRSELNEKAIAELAAKEGTTPEALKNVDKELAAIDEEASLIQQEGQKNADIVTKAFDPEIQEVSKIQIEIEKEAAKRLDEHRQVREQEATAAENEATKLEQESTKATEAELAQVKEQYAKAQARVTELENQAAARLKEEQAAIAKEDKAKETLEKTGLDRASKKVEKDINSTSSAVEKLKALGKSTKHIEEGLAKLKERKASLKSEDGLNTEERGILRRLKAQAARRVKPTGPEDVLTPAEKKELNSLLELTAKVKEKLKSKPEIPPKVKDKVDKLRKFAQDKKAEAATKTVEDFLSKKEKSNLDAVKQKKEELRNQKAEAQQKRKSYLSDAQKERLKDLTSKREKLAATKDKVNQAKKEKNKVLTPEDEEAIKKLTSVLPSLEEGTTAHNKVQEALNKLESKVKGPQVANNWRAYWFANVLSGPATHIVNMVSNLTQLMSIPTSYAVTGELGAAKVFIDSIVRNAGESLSSASDAFKTGETKIREGKFQSSKSDFVKEGPAYIRKLGYVLRALSAEDEFFYHNIREAQAKAVAYYEGKKLGLEGEALRNKVAQDLNRSPESWDLNLKKARDQAKFLKEQAGVDLTESQIRNTAWEMLIADRPDLVKTESHRFALENTFNNPPKGLIGEIVKGMTKMTEATMRIPGTNKTVKPLAYVFPFMKISGNLLNNFLDFAGAGYVRAALKTESVTGDSPYAANTIHTKHALQRKQELGKAIIGTIGTAALYGIARQFIDDKDPYFAIYGPGPKDVDMKNQLRNQKNWMPYSIKIGNNLIPFNYTPFVLPLGALGAIHDQVRWSKRYEKAQEEEAISLAVSGMMGAFVDNSFLKTISNVIGAISGDPAKDILDIPVNISKGFIPASGALRAIANITDDPITTKKDLWAKIVSGIPMAQSIGTKPALNTFGDPIEKTLAERLSLNRFWDTQSTDPDWEWLAHNGYDLPDAGGTDIKLSTKINPQATKKRIENMGAIFADQLTPEERYELTEKSGPDIRAIVAKYRERYGSSGFQEDVQKKLKEEIAAKRLKWKKDLFLH